MSIFSLAVCVDEFLITKASAILHCRMPSEYNLMKKGYFIKFLARNTKLPLPLPWIGNYALQRSPKLTPLNPSPKLLFPQEIRRNSKNWMLYTLLKVISIYFLISCMRIRARLKSAEKSKLGKKSNCIVVLTSEPGEY